MPAGADGWSRYELTGEDLEGLRKAIAATKFDAIRRNSDQVGPAAADGSNVTVEFAAAGGSLVAATAVVPTLRAATSSSVVVIQ